MTHPNPPLQIQFQSQHLFCGPCMRLPLSPNSDVTDSSSHKSCDSFASLLSSSSSSSTSSKSPPTRSQVAQRAKRILEKEKRSISIQEMQDLLKVKLMGSRHLKTRETIVHLSGGLCVLDPSHTTFQYTKRPVCKPLTLQREWEISLGETWEKGGSVIPMTTLLQPHEKEAESILSGLVNDGHAGVVQLRPREYAVYAIPEWARCVDTTPLLRELWNLEIKGIA